MQLDHIRLRTFIACLDTMSFSRAAALVHKSPATISTQIAHLEEEIGAPLFIRDTRNLSLTRAGEQLEGYARRMLRLHDEAIESFRRPDMAGSVTIGAPDDYMAFMLPPVLRRFGALFPKVEINVVCAQSTMLAPQIERGGIDLAIITRQAGMKGELIRREPMVWIASPDRLALERTPLPVALFEPGSRARAVALAALARGSVSYRSAYESFSYSALLTLVEAGLAVAAVTQGSAPPTLVRLGAEDGLPAMEPLEIVLVRGAGSDNVTCNAFAEAILGDAPSR